MRTYSSVMYAANSANSEFWLGTVNKNGEVTGFTDFIPSSPMHGLVGGDEILYYVQVEESDSVVDVHVVQWYRFEITSERGCHSINLLVDEGKINPIKLANRVLNLLREHRH